MAFICLSTASRVQRRTMPTCSVKNCSNNTRKSLKKDGVSYFIFPKNEIRRSDWTAIIGNNRGEEFYKPHKFSHVCSEHFLSSDIHTTAKGFKRLSLSAIPKLNLSTPINYSNVTVYNPTQNELGLNQENQFHDNIMNSPDVGSEIKQESPSSPLSIGSILDTPRKVDLKKKLNLCKKMIHNKNKQINRLQKQNKRLVKKNIILKKALSILKERRSKKSK